MGNPIEMDDEIGDSPETQEPSMFGTVLNYVASHGLVSYPFPFWVKLLLQIRTQLFYRS